MSSIAPLKISNVPIPLRLVVALLLGLQFGLLAFYRAPVSGWAWLPWLPLVILLAATIASIWYDPRVREGEIDPDHVLQGLVRFLLVIIVPVFILILASFFIRSIGALVLALIPLALGVITAFTVIGSRNVGLAIACGMLTWLGAGPPFLFSTYLASQQPGNAFSYVVFLLLTFGVLAGFLFAALGGYLGHLLRRWVLG
jgi:hypothetical protein